MGTNDDQLPRHLQPFPDRRLSFDYLRAVDDLDSVRDVYVPRHTSPEDADCDESAVWELHVGSVPSVDIGEFLVDNGDVLARIEYRDDGWYVVDRGEKDESPGQIFAALIKPYVSVRRVLEARRFEERHR